MRLRSILALIPAALLIAGCSAVGQMPIELDQKAKTMQPPEGKALVYVVRSSSIGKSVKMEVTCDGRLMGATGGKRYIYAAVDPGPHLFISRAENSSELPIELEAGRTYFLEQKVQMGLLKARNKLERIDEAEGRQKLDECALSSELGGAAP